MVTSSRLFIGNLNYETNVETIGHLFETIGEVDYVKISFKNGRSLGYGFIEMADVESAEKHSLSSTDTYQMVDKFVPSNINCQQYINIPQSLALIELKSAIGTHFNLENDQQTLALRSGRRECLLHIQYYGDASAQSELVNANYTGVLVIAISTASGHGEEYDKEIYDGFQTPIFLEFLNKR
ncbi:MAG: hypothetical protein EZS28_006950 [Streblomastix strix]|uniref:RRM domain-containing protein n=1 Tax=Streblomastix strix TaxID=222440 RepID=A0A5J4WRF6_9EUKA|nr:MAG: hypothetical protein EZS28_006950 [Streblomastix strix]